MNESEGLTVVEALDVFTPKDDLWTQQVHSAAGGGVVDAEQEAFDLPRQLGQALCPISGVRRSRNANSLRVT
jgi:hypothetical protein